MDASAMVKELAKIQRERLVVKTALISEEMKARLISALDEKERSLSIQERIEPASAGAASAAAKGSKSP